MHTTIQLDAGTEIQITKTENGTYELFITSDRTSHLSLKIQLTPEMMNEMYGEMLKLRGM